MKKEPVAESVPSVADELSDARLGDARREARLRRISAAAEERPGASFPVQAGSAGALEGTYRLLNNANVSEEELLGSHAGRTVRRGSSHEEVLVLHDTSKFQFRGETHRDGLGYLPNKGQGFYGHFALCVGLEGRPLGVLGVETNFRTAERKGRQSPSVAQADPTRESLRWGRLTLHADRLLEGHARAIHVMDREADSYELFHALTDAQCGFVIRLFRTRTLVESEEEAFETLFGGMDAAPRVLERTVSVSPRAKKGSKTRQKIYPWRRARPAALEFKARAFTIKRPRCAASALPAQMTLNFVAVREIGAPEGQAPISWNLVTTEPIDTPAQVAKVVDIYRVGGSLRSSSRRSRRAATTKSVRSPTATRSSYPSLSSPPSPGACCFYAG